VSYSDFAVAVADHMFGHALEQSLTRATAAGIGLRLIRQLCQARVEVRAHWQMFAMSHEPNCTPPKRLGIT
jgi:hypothetical protein